MKSYGKEKGPSIAHGGSLPLALCCRYRHSSHLEALSPTRLNPRRSAQSPGRPPASHQKAGPQLSSGTASLPRPEAAPSPATAAPLHPPEPERRLRALAEEGAAAATINVYWKAAEKQLPTGSAE